MAIALEVVLFVFELLAVLSVVLISSTLIGMQYDKEVNHNPLIVVGGLATLAGVVYVIMWSAF